MGALCDLALAVGMTLSGACQPAGPAADPMPADDPNAWIVKPAPAKEAPAPAPAPQFPVIIQRQVIHDAPPSPPQPTASAPLGPDVYEQGVRDSYLSRSTPNNQWPEVAVPASLARYGVGGGSGGLPQVPPMALDLASMTGGQTDRVYKEKAITSSRPVDNQRIVTTDRYISGILETGINTQLDGATGGPVVIQTTRDVFGYHGRNILIPKGSRLVCVFKSLAKIGSSRAPLRCSRLLLGGSRAEIFGIKSNVTDVQGALGVSGEVDSRFLEKYGTAFILTAISAGVRAASGGGTASTATTTTTAASTSTETPMQAGSQELSQRLGEITASTLQQTMSLIPILKVAQGTRIQIRPDTDWYIAPAQGETP